MMNKTNVGIYHKAYLELCRKSKGECFSKKVNAIYLFTVFAKLKILDG